MYYKIVCTNCQKSLKVREENLGRKARCPYCHHSVAVPAGEAAMPVAASRRDESGQQATPSQSQSSATSSHEWTDSTNVNMLLSLLIGLGIAATFLIVLIPFRSVYLGKLFYERGWVQFALVFLMSWSFGILILKWRKVARQKESMLFDVLPNEIADEITSKTADQFANHIRSLPAEPGASFLMNRVMRGLEHYRVRKNASEVAGIMASQSDIDANNVESSYSILKVFIWAIPILGFIGTVIGISDAVSGFSGSLENVGKAPTAMVAPENGDPPPAVENGEDKAGELDMLKKSLFKVTNGLATAFDTTLVALVMSLLVMFPTSSMQKAEDDVLNWVDEYCNENLIKRLQDGGASGGSSEDGKFKFDVDATVQKAIDAALAGNQGAMLHQISQVQQTMSTMQKDQVEQLNGAMTGLTDRTEAVQQEVASNMLAASDSLKNYFVGLEHGLEALNGVLTKLGEKQIVIEQQTPAKKGWFGRKG